MGLASSRLAVAALLIVVSGCGVLQPAGEAEGGPGLPQQRPTEEYPGTRRELTGELRVAADGCAFLEVDGVPLLAIWPAGSELSRPVRLPDGTELEHGDELRVTAAVLATGALPGGPDGYWGSVTMFCDTDEVIVIDAVTEHR